MITSKHMNWLVEVFATPTRAVFLKKALLLQLVINIVASGAMFLLAGELVGGIFVHYSINTLVAFPFVCLALSIINHMGAMQAELAHLAATDVLTGLSNRRAFFERVNLRLSKVGGGYLLLADADHFKAINDTYGHDVGDASLIAISEHLRKIVGDQQIIGRVGGEEFALFITKDGTPAIEITAAALCQPIDVHTIRVQMAKPLTLSVGVTNLETGTDIKAGLTRADIALYAAKRNGRAQFAIEHQDHAA